MGNRRICDSLRIDGGNNNPANPENYTIESGTIILKILKETDLFLKGGSQIPITQTGLPQFLQGETVDVVIYAKWIEIFKVSFIITTDGINPARDVDIIINNTHKLKSDISGLADTLLVDGSS
jgi:hypothetical protein